MIRASTLILGLGLAVLAFLGWISTEGTGWVSAFDLLGAFWALLISARSSAFAPPNPEGERALAGGPILLGLGLIIVWILAYSNPMVAKWQAWWTFSVGCASLIVGVATLLTKGQGRRPLPH